ncbi:MAG: hypothetical protein LBQ50_01210 [Planctomycetaceae bacterium]|jgi:hypothetical protein|nr:hypothetical protein [Planctomycetaceae bacterium]
MESGNNSYKVGGIYWKTNLEETTRKCGLTYWERMFPVGASAYLHAIGAWTEHKEMFEMAKEMLKENAVSVT